MLRWVFIGLIRGYRKFISPLFPPTCRFTPTCSNYGLEAYRVHGTIKGTILTVWRVLRCGPWLPGGFDPVPEKGRWRDGLHVHPLAENQVLGDDPSLSDGEPIPPVLLEDRRGGSLEPADSDESDKA